MADLISRMIQECREFDFYQAVSIFQSLFANDRCCDSIDSGKIRFEPDPSISFPVSDISSIYQKDDSIRFLLSFMSLTGVSSPLPVYFSQYISECHEKSSDLEGFLSIFNHRIYTLFFRAWERNNLTCIINDNKSKFFKTLLSLAGRDIDSPLVDNFLHVVYCSIFAGKSGSRSGLISILSDYFDNIPVNIVEFVPRWVRLQYSKSLGNGASLGQNAIAGSSVFDRSAKFRIVLGPLQLVVYETFLPGKPKLNKLIEIVDAFISDALVYDIELQLNALDLVEIVLGENDACLGVNASLGKNTGDQIYSVLLEDQGSLCK